MDGSIGRGRRKWIKKADGLARKRKRERGWEKRERH